MRSLNDLSYFDHRAIVPWPKVEDSQGRIDWVLSVDSVESWLVQTCGAHYKEWVWSMWALHNPYLCGVSFKRSSSCLLFTLRFS